MSRSVPPRLCLAACALLAACGCRDAAQALRVEVTGALAVDAVRLEVARASGEPLASDEVSSPLPVRFNLLPGPTTPAGTQLRLTARGFSGGREVARAASTVELSPGGTHTLALEPLASGTDGGAPDAGQTDAGTPDGGCVPTAEVCGNGQDEDCDGLRDCADSDCAGSACGADGRVCQGGACVCGGGGAPEPNEATCGDGRDNDCDGRTDCADPDCATRSCGASPRLFCDGTLRSCSCTARDRRLDGARFGQSAVVGQGNGGMRVLYTGTTGGTGVFYTECVSGCQGATPVFSAPLQLAPASANAGYRPQLLELPGGGLVAAFKRAAPEQLVYAECAGGCTQAAGWTLRGFAATGLTVGLAARGFLRAVAYQYEDGGGAASAVTAYAECATPPCAAGGAAWSTRFFPMDPYGAALLFDDLPDGGARRTAVLGNDTGPALHAECTDDCASAGAGGWTTTALPSLVNPQLVQDARGGLRLFHSASDIPASLRVARCELASCADAGSWSYATVFPDAGHPSAGRGPDGGTFVVSSLNGAVWTAVERADGGYAAAPMQACTGVVGGTFASGAQDSAGRWHLSFGAGGEQRGFSELP